MHEPKHSHPELDWPGSHADLQQVASSRAADSAARTLRGGVAFASPEVQTQRISELLGEGALVVAVPPLQATMRGHLAEHVEETLERELASRGAPSPYLAAWSAMPDDADERLADQLFRARTVGASGIALVMGSLSAAAYPAVSPEDSATLRWLAGAAMRAPLLVLIDDADAFVGAYDAPVALSALVAHATRGPECTSIETAPSRPVHAASLVQSNVGALAPSTSVPDGAPAPSNSLPDGALALATNLPAAHQEAVKTSSEGTRADVIAQRRRRGAGVVARGKRELAAESRLGAAALEAAETEAAAEHADASTPTVDDASTAAGAAATASSASTVEPNATWTKNDRAERNARSPAHRATAGVPIAGANDFWRSRALALGAVRGPLPLAAFEKLFAESYVPLANAIATGLDDPRAMRAYDDFRRTFERAYTDAFATFGATNRRPRLVMDAYDVAAKQARLHNARTAHVLMIDSLRWDIGMVVRDALSAKAAARASLTAECVLWSALPTTTIRQLETIGRGIDALRAPATDEPQESFRGRSAEVVRRMRVGSRELYKLDIIPAILGSMGDEPGAEQVVDALELLGQTVAEIVARHVQTLAPRTLLLVVGDHGFTVDRRGRVLHGGASPEEVLVPAHAWLVGELH